VAVDFGDGRYGQRIGAMQAAAIGPTDGAWLHGVVTCTNANEVYTLAVSPSITATYLKVNAQTSASDTTPVEAIVRINADPTASTSTNVNGVGYCVSGTEMIPLDGTAVVTVRVMSPTAGAYVRVGLANPSVY
jgi:hypothetical protein